MGYKVAIVSSPRQGTAKTEDWSEWACGALTAAGHAPQVVAASENLAVDLTALMADACIIACDDHGDEIRQTVEALAIPCLGADCATRRFVGDKALLRDELAHRFAAGELDHRILELLLLPGRIVAETVPDEVIGRIVDRIPGGYPVLVGGTGDPVRSFTHCHDTGSLRDGARERCAASGAFVMAEYSEGLRLAVFVLGDAEDAQVLPAALAMGFGTEKETLTCPVGASMLSHDLAEAESIRSEVERAALEAYVACGLQDMGRIDLIWDGARVRIVDVDPSCDFSAGSGLSLAAGAAGVSLETALGYLVEAVVERGGRR